MGSLELRENFFDTITNRRERIHYRTSLDPRASLPKLYQRLRARLHVHLSFHPVIEESDYCVVFGDCSISRDPVNEPWILRSSKCDPCAASGHEPDGRSLDSHGHTFVFGEGANDLNTLVFIGVVDFSEHPEEVMGDCCSNEFASLIRLTPLDTCDALGIDTDELTTTDGPLVESSTITDGELKLSPLSRPSRECRQRTNQKIKRRPKIVGDVSNHNAPIVTGIPMNVGNQGLSTQAIARGIRVGLYTEGIGIGFEEPIYSLLQRVEVLVCPAKLQSWPSEIRHDKETQDSDYSTRRGNPDSQAERRDARSSQGGES